MSGKSYISKVTLPSGNTYYIKDQEARDAIAGGITFVISWDGESTPTVANIPEGVTVTYNNTDYTGTMSAVSAQVNTFYLVKEINNVYSEYVRVRTGEEGSYSYSWERLGDTALDLSNLGELAYKDNIIIYKGNGDIVLGEGTTFTNSSSAVSFESHTTDGVLGSDATFTTSVTPTTTNIKATATGTAVGADGTDTFVKSYPGTSSKLATTSITGTNGTDTATLISDKVSKKLSTTTVPNVTSAGSASTWAFSMGTGDDAETLIITGANSTAPTLGTAITCATGSLASTSETSNVGGEIVSSFSTSNKTLAKIASSATTVATGSLDSNGSGDSVMTGLGTATTASALTGVKVTTQPTVALSTGATAGTGVISVATGITSATTSVDSKDEVTAITALGAATAAAQTITVGTNDKVKVAKYNDILGGTNVIIGTEMTTVMRTVTVTVPQYMKINGHNENFTYEIPDGSILFIEYECDLRYTLNSWTVKNPLTNSSISMTEVTGSHAPYNSSNLSTGSHVSSVPITSNVTVTASTSPCLQLTFIKGTMIGKTSLDDGNKLTATWYYNQSQSIVVEVRAVDGYNLNGWSVYKTGQSNVTISTTTLSGNMTGGSYAEFVFTAPNYNVTVEINDAVKIY